MLNKKNAKTIAKKLGHYGRWLDDNGFRYIDWHTGGETYYGFVIRKEHAERFYSEAKRLKLSVS